MALRSLGSSLLARAGSGSRLRSGQEERAGGAVARQASGAQPSNVARQQIQEPLERQVPTGTQKVLSVAPVIQPKVEGSIPNVPSIVPGIGSSGVAPVAPAGGIRPNIAARGPQAAQAAAPVKSGVNQVTQVKRDTGQVLGVGKTQTPGQVNQNKNTKSNLPAGSNIPNIGLSGRVQAETPGIGSTGRTPVVKQYEGQFGKAIDTIGKLLGNPLPEFGYSERAEAITPQEQAFNKITPEQQRAREVALAPLNIAKGVGAAGKTVASLTGQGVNKAAQSVSKVATPIVKQAPKAAQNVIRSVQQTVQKAVNQVTNFLRSLTRR